MMRKVLSECLNTCTMIRMKMKNGYGEVGYTTGDGPAGVSFGFSVNIIVTMEI